MSNLIERLRGTATPLSYAEKTLYEAAADEISRLSSWQPIETAPRDGTEVVCWRNGWQHPTFLCYRENSRISAGRKRGLSCGNMVDAYFGDPNELDDYDLADPANAPTHWFPLPQPPVK